MLLSNKEVYISVDIESDGPIPGPHSMLSLGAAAFYLDGSKAPASTFSVNLEHLEGAQPDPKTMTEFWDKNPEAWAAARKDVISPAEAMAKFVDWVMSLEGKPVFVAYPAGFDFTFVYWYMIKFVARSPFSFSALDIKTLGMLLCRKGYRGSTKRNMPKYLFEGTGKHTHVGLDDAIEQGILFVNMMEELNNKLY